MTTQPITGTEAKAKALYDAYNAAYIEHLFRGAPEPKGEDYGYRHGWIIVDDQAFPSTQWYPANQPIMD